MIPSGTGRFRTVRSMIVIHQGALGDFILALPTLSALRETFPQARTAMMGYPRILQLAKDRFYADEIYSVDQRGMASFFVREGGLDHDLSRFFSGFDLIVVFGKDREGPLIQNLRKVSRGEILHLDSLPKWDEGVHLADHLLNQLSQYGLSPGERLPRLFLKGEDRDWANHFWLTHGVNPEERSKIILLHPGSGSRKKVWPLNRFLDLLRWLSPRLEGRFLVVLGPAEGPEVQKAFEQVDGPRPVIARGLSLVELASVMEGARLFIGNDSGISHLAAALRIPVVAIFGPTDPRVWSPRGEKVVVIRKGLPCTPCAEERFFLCKEMACLDQITLSDVIEGLRQMGLKV
ncbi:MAG: glycosyltransferase family 9 protein [Desulfobacterota bacterium]|nr:glycosyltransferase family 9 protein [Thermodesulfobacteriota bacterium]